MSNEEGKTSKESEENSVDSFADATDPSISAENSLENSNREKTTRTLRQSPLDESKQLIMEDSDGKLRDLDASELADEEDEHTGGELGQDAEPGKFLFRLLSIHFGKGKGGRKVYKCDICPGVYRHAFSLKRHYLRTHINYDYLSEADISNCNISIQGSSKKTIDEVDGDGSTMTGLFKCQTCGQLFDDKHELKHHLANHPSQANDKRFPCTQCEMTFSHRQNLVRHLSVHSGEKPYPCRYCGKRFPTATNQKRHERIHEGVKPYVCSQCGSVFTQSGDLKKHIRKQHLQFFHPCAFCVKYFVDEGQLVKHLASHGETVESNKQGWVKRNANAAKVAASKKAMGTNRRNAKPQNQRGNGTVTSAVLPKADQKSFKCKVCSKRFSSYLTLRRHQQSMHTSKTGTPRITPIIQPLTRCQYDEKMNRREPPLTEADFYADIAYNISDNLLNHLDGKICEPPQQRTLCDHLDCDREATRRNLHRDWTSYNFPPWFDLQSANSLDDGLGRGETSDSDEVFDLSKPKSNPSVNCVNPSNTSVHVESVTLSHSDMLYSLALSPVHSCSSGEFTSVDGALDLSLPSRERRPSSIDSPLSVEVPRTYVCFACGEYVTSYEDMEDHKLNNHPNVYCTHLEIEGTKELPLQLFKQRCSPVGVLHNCLVPPTISCVESLVCTKCDQHFSLVTDLHCHMLECGGHYDSSRAYSKRSRRRRMVKRGMKRKLEATPQKKPLTLSSAKKSKRDTPDKSLQSSSGRSSAASKSSSTPLLQSPTFSCSNCQMTFSQQSALDRHGKKCTPKPTLPKPALPKPTLPKPVLSAKKVDPRQQHACSYCARTFTYLASLKKHMTDCVSRKEKEKHKKASPGKSSKATGKDKKRKHSVSKNPSPEVPEESDPSHEQEPEPEPETCESSLSEQGEETTSSEFSSSSKTEVVVDSVPAEESSTLMSQIKQEVEAAEDEASKEAVAVASDENELKQQVADVKLEDEKRALEGHCHACPHCRRTYTYLANFKKHVSEACPLRKDPPKSAMDDSGQEEEEAKEVLIEDGTDDEVKEATPVAEEEEDGEGEQKKDHDSDDSWESVDGTGESPSKSEAESGDKEKADKKHLSCPICDRLFVSYVKLLQHQLSHKLKPEEKADGSEDGDGEPEGKFLCPNCQQVFDGPANLKRHKTRCNGRKTNRKRKTTVVAATKPSTIKHRGGWPKGKSRKGYIPKHKRTSANDAEESASGPKKAKTEADGPPQKLDQSKENDSGDAEESPAVVSPTPSVTPPVQGKAPLEEQPAHNNVMGSNHLEGFRSTPILRRVKPRQKRNSTLLVAATKVPTPEPPPPTAVAS